MMHLRDLARRVRLPVALSLPEVLAPLHLEHDHLARAVLLDDLALDLGARDQRTAHLHFGARGQKKHVRERDLAARLARELLDPDRLAFGDPILFAAGFDDRIHERGSVWFSAGLSSRVADMPDPDRRRRSRVVTDGPSRAPARAMLKAIGFTDADLQKPLVGIANTWIETMPCNFHLRGLAEQVKQGVRSAGGTPMEFNTIAISDGVVMGTEGMKASLISREIIADSIELCGRGYSFDAMVALVGCDKTMPGAAMALCRLDIPGIILYGGSIAAGKLGGRDLTVQDVVEAVGALAAGRMTAADVRAIEDAACPGAGACGGQFTANTMAVALEFLSLSALGTASVPALDPRKNEVAQAVGRLVMDLLARDERPRALVTRDCLENAIASVAATGGSTNAVLHLLAIAREAGLALSIDDFDRVSARTPLLCDL